MSRILPIILALLIVSAARAETAYVTDILRLGIHRASDTSDQAFDNLASGAELEVLERSINYARVRTAGGQEGWVKAAYLVSEKPAQLRVAEMEAQLAAMQAKLAAAEAEAAHAEQDAGRLNQQALDDRRSAEAMRESLARLKEQNEDYAARFGRLSLPWTWVAAALVLTLIGGFVGGWWWLDAAIRRRHGGFRVY